MKNRPNDPLAPPSTEQNDRSKGVFLRGKYVHLKVLEQKDAEESNWYDWFNDEEVSQFLQHHYFPNSSADQVNFWQNQVRGNRSKIQLGIYDAKGGPLLGVQSLDAIDPINRKATIATVIGEREGRNLKFFLEANQLVIRHAFDALNLRRIYGGTISKSVADMLCRWLGFKMEGVLRQDVYKNGQYHDSHLFGLVAEEFHRADL